MSNPSDLIGKRFSKLTVVSRAENSRHMKARWFCSCDCGGSTTTTTGDLKNGHTTSCGCHFRAMASKANITHGHTKDGINPTYKSWASMIQRCNNPKNPNFADYGGRGITVCHEWSSFDGFLTDMGERPDGLTIERINNEIGYSKENCRWATRADQMANTRNNIHITINGETRILVDWSRLSGVHPDTIRARLSRGWSAEQAVFRHASKSSSMSSSSSIC